MVKYTQSYSMSKNIFIDTSNTQKVTSYRFLCITLIIILPFVVTYNQYLCQKGEKIGDALILYSWRVVLINLLVMTADSLAGKGIAI